MPDHYKVSLRAARVNANMTQTEAAEAIGVDKTTILRWEQGKSYPDYFKLESLCKAYDVPIDNIFLSRSSLTVNNPSKTKGG